MNHENRPQEKVRLHPRNKNRERYDLDALKLAIPALKSHVQPNKYGVESVDFADPKAVKLLNQALLKHYYGIEIWDFPNNNLCPPIPGRADYIHYIADLLGERYFGKIPTGEKVTCLDVGVGASCIYPIIGVTEYGWRFIGSDIDPKSIISAQKIVDANPSLNGMIECRLQKESNDIFRGIITDEDKIDVVICNPPFHASLEDAQKGTRRKVQNLSSKKTKTLLLNFAGINHELVYEGGEFGFIQKMIRESKLYSAKVFWFSALVSKESNLKGIYQSLNNVEAKQVRTIPMGTGNKSSRIVAWSFFA